MGFIIEFLKCGNNFTPFVSLHPSWTNFILNFAWDISRVAHMVWNTEIISWTLRIYKISAKNKLNFFVRSWECR